MRLVLSQGHILSAGFSVMLLGLVAFSMLVEQQGLAPNLGSVGFSTPLIILFYGVAVYTVFRYEHSSLREHTGELAERYPHVTDFLSVPSMGP